VNSSSTISVAFLYLSHCAAILFRTFFAVLDGIQNALPIKAELPAIFRTIQGLVISDAREPRNPPIPDTHRQA
jgi:hypothetical protein